MENGNNYVFIVSETVKSLLMLILSAWLFFNSPLGLVILAPYAVFSVYRIARKNGERQRDELIIQFKDALGSLQTSLEAGESIEAAIYSAKNDLLVMHGPDAFMVREFSNMERRLSLSENIEDIFMDFAEKTRVREIENFADVFLVAKRSGGDIIALIKDANRSLYDKIELRREIEGIIASTVTECMVMKYMPLAILLYLRLFSGSFMAPLYATAPGKLCMMLVCLLYFVFCEYIERLTAQAGR